MKVSGQLHTPAALPPRKETVVPTGQEAEWGEEKNSLPPPGIEP